MSKQNPTPNIPDNDLKHLASRAFSLIELVEVAGIPENSFLLIRKKLLNLGNDILRLNDKEGDA